MPTNPVEDFHPVYWRGFKIEAEEVIKDDCDIFCEVIAIELWKLFEVHQTYSAKFLMVAKSRWLVGTTKYRFYQVYTISLVPVFCQNDNAYPNSYTQQL